MSESFIADLLYSAICYGYRKSITSISLLVKARTSPCSFGFLLSLSDVLYGYGFLCFLVQFNGLFIMFKKNYGCSFLSWICSASVTCS